MQMLFITIPILLISIQAGGSSGSFGTGVFVFIGLNVLVGLVWGLIKRSAHNVQAGRQQVHARRMRTHLNINDVAFAHQLLARFGLLDEGTEKAADAEVRASSFSNIPLSVRKIEERLAGATLHDADEALEFLSGEHFLTAAQAQTVQDRLDQRMGEGRFTLDDRDAMRSAATAIPAAASLG